MITLPAGFDYIAFLQEILIIFSPLVGIWFFIWCYHEISDIINRNS